jgi:hypothetical protein
MYVNVGLEGAVMASGSPSNGDEWGGLTRACSCNTDGLSCSRLFLILYLCVLPIQLQFIQDITQHRRNSVAFNFAT